MSVELTKSEIHSSLHASIAEIEGMDRPACLERWREVFGRSTPKHVSVQFMKCVLIWELQCRLLGSVSSKTERTLKRIAAGKPQSATAKPGSRLVREWNGRTYQVEVTNDGYLMDGRIYRSLSAVAHRITGAKWSGPRFFGVG